MQKDLKGRVHAAIQALPDQDRTVMMLFHINQFSQKEIASFLEIPVTTVNNRLHASRKRLKKELINVAKENLYARRPSRDEMFASRVREHLKTLEALHNNYTSLLKEALSDATGRELDVVIHSVEQSTFAGFIQTLSSPCCTYTFLVRPEEFPEVERGPVAVNLSFPLACAIADCEAPEKISRHERGEKIFLTEEREKLTVVAVKMLKGIERILQTQVSRAELETDPDYVSFRGYAQEDQAIHVGQDAPIVFIRMDATSKDGVDRVCLCYPFSTLESAVVPYWGQAK